MVLIHILQELSVKLGLNGDLKNVKTSLTVL